MELITAAGALLAAKDNSQFHHLNKILFLGITELIEILKLITISPTQNTPH